MWKVAFGRIKSRENAAELHLKTVLRAVDMPRGVALYPTAFNLLQVVGGTGISALGQWSMWSIWSGKDAEA